MLRRFDDAEQLARGAAEYLVDVAREAIDARGRFTVALAGGKTPQRLYALLAAPPFSGQLPWDRVEFFWGDERAVPPGHADSNFRMANEALLRPLTIAPSQIHRMQAEQADLENVAVDYQAEIGRVFDIDPDGEPPRFDLVLLGMGADGHTASLFPFTEATKEETRWVISNYVPKLDSFRLTLTARILNKAAHVLFLVAGEDKADALAQVLEGEHEPLRLPAQLIQPEEGELAWFIDTLAATKLTRERLTTND
jgi:6-phosphogluconolactonase